MPAEFRPSNLCQRGACFRVRNTIAKLSQPVKAGVLLAQIVLGLAILAYAELPTKGLNMLVDVAPRDQAIPGKTGVVLLWGLVSSAEALIR